jgi:hypothetical protein
MRRLLLALAVHGALAAAAAAQTPADVLAIDALVLADERCTGGAPAAGKRELLMRRPNAVHLDAMFGGLSNAEIPEMPTPAKRLRTAFPNAAQATIDAFLRDNSRRSRVDLARLRALNASELGDADYERLAAAPDFWEEFHRRFPRAHAFVELAQVSVNAERTEALAYCSHYAGALAARGAVALLRRDQAGWTIVRWLELWVS